ncbi:MAG: serine/threonine-protein kinase, partial [Chloroflexota bacterium]
MHIPLTNPAPRGTPAASAAAPPPQGGGTVVPFNAPTASSFEDTLRSLTQQSPAAAPAGTAAG